MIFGVTNGVISGKTIGTVDIQATPREYRYDYSYRYEINPKKLKFSTERFELFSCQTPRIAIPSPDVITTVFNWAAQVAKFPEVMSL
ncbi:hypothetical protein EDM56_20060 [Brevibacillus fluminis]|uniref:Uncharacterized protein n=1 Tax=Brevibacillus fluminis TaxID=511487 RepID=A0A3M8D9P0_9BACL|nr:hypothetical protein EDM56_20060 [Brevibacillus fluminis]